MNACLIHSPTAGEGHPTRRELLEALDRHGYRASYHRMGEAGWRQCIEDDTVDLVVVAGGDGTVKRVGMALAGRNMPVAVIPTGTANNIARALGSVGPLDRLLRSFRSAPRSRVVVGCARGPWGEERFLEAVGFGVFGRTMRDADDARRAEAPQNDRGQRLDEDVRLLLSHVRTQPATYAELRLDGQLVTGEYLLVSVMGLPSMGPLLELAPEADLADGHFDVAFVSADQRADLEHHLVARLEGRTSSSLATVRKARSIRVQWHGRDVHVDDIVWPPCRTDIQDVEGPIEVQVEATTQWITAVAPSL